MNNYTIETGRNLLKWRPYQSACRFWTEQEARAAVDAAPAEDGYVAFRILRNGEPIAFKDSSGWESHEPVSTPYKLEPTEQLLSPAKHPEPRP